MAKLKYILASWYPRRLFQYICSSSFKCDRKKQTSVD